MSRWGLARALMVALSFLLVTVALATIPGRALGYWYLYYSPVAISALSFGLVGALVASGWALVSVMVFALRVDQVAQRTGLSLAQRLGGQDSPLFKELQEALAQMAPDGALVDLGKSPLGVTPMQSLLFQATVGVALITAVCCLVGWLVDENRRKFASYRLQALTDSLTGVGNYRQLMDALSEEISRGRRFSRQFAFLMVDVDGLKLYNDGYGHLVGDTLLRETSNMLRSQVRDIDTVARYGGDEFGVVLVETNEAGATVAAERLRQAIEGHIVSAGATQASVTISIGVALYPQNGQTATQLIEAADVALYEAKRGGKNVVAVATA